MSEPVSSVQLSAMAPSNSRARTMDGRRVVAYIPFVELGSAHGPPALNGVRLPLEPVSHGETGGTQRKRAYRDSDCGLRRQPAP